MSDSDDTDILLLIPPGIYIDSVERDIELASIQSQVVGNLIEHVGDLENRISFIESLNDSFDHDSLAGAKSNNSMVLNDCDTSAEIPLATEEPANHQDLVSPTCALNTFEINSNTESSLDLHQRENDISKSKEELLKEIDVYLNNINLKKPREDGGSLKSSSDSNDNSIRKEAAADMTEGVPERPFQRLDLPEVDRLLKEMERTQNEIENKLRMRESEYGLSDQKSFPNVSLRRSFPPGDSPISQERSSAPFINYSSPLKSYDSDQPKGLDEVAAKRDSYLVGSSQNSDSDDARKIVFGSSAMHGRNLRSVSSFDSKKRFISPRRKLFPSDPVPLRKPASGQSSVLPSTSVSDLGLRKDYSSMHGGEGNMKSLGGGDSNILRGKNPLSYDRDDLLSLAELWRNERDLTDDDSKKLRQKLEEEKYRRIHLEKTIQDLQKRVLEEQEKLAVAMKVDEGKDKAIAQITDAWKRMVNRWREIEADRHAMSQSVIKEKALITQKEEELKKKVERWEKEVSQALDLAAGYKSKYEMLENELSQTIESNNDKTKEFEKKLKSLEEELKQLYEERKVLTDKLNITQEEHNKEKQLVELSQKEVASLQELLKNSEAELAVVKEQRDLLSTRLREEKGRITNLEQQKNGLQQALDDTSQKLEEVEDLLKNSEATFEKKKADLKAVYQNQLESVVKEKLDEFQSVLDQAQAGMKAELNEAKRSAQERMAAQKQSLIASHTIELTRIEAMYKDEVRRLESQLMESEKRREKLESEKKDMTLRLHKVLEAQWQKALSVINNEVSFIDQGDSDAGNLRVLEPRTNQVIKIGDMDSSFDETPYLREIPNVNKCDSNAQDTLLKYIKILLEKQPGKPIDSCSSGLWPEVTPTETLDESIGEHKWNQIITNAANLAGKNFLEPSRPNTSNKKPPWKPT